MHIHIHIYIYIHCIHCILSIGSFEEFQLYINYHAELIDERIEGDMTMLHLACISGNYEIVNLLLTKQAYTEVDFEIIVFLFLTVHFLYIYVSSLYSTT